MTQILDPETTTILPAVAANCVKRFKASSASDDRVSLADVVLDYLKTLVSAELILLITDAMRLNPRIGLEYDSSGFTFAERQLGLLLSAVLEQIATEKPNVFDQAIRADALKLSVEAAGTTIELREPAKAPA